MSQTHSIKPLGNVLQQADLVSADQIEAALREQMRSKNKRLGEILVLQGWIEQKTADFFAERLPSLRDRPSKQPLGQYLKEAALLNDEQISVILDEQQQTGLRFGEVAVKKGWLKSATIDFFLNLLGGRQSKNGSSSAIEQRDISQSSQHLRQIRQRLLENHRCEPLRLLRLYRQILRHGAIPANDTPEQGELLAIGLVVERQGKLRVSNRLYQSIFNRSWVEQELVQLQPFSQIRLKLFKLDEKASYPYSVLEEILDWTGEQFYLTQKLCQLIAESKIFIIAGEEVRQVEHIVRDRLLDNWQNQSAGEHLKTIENRLLDNRRCKPLQLLKLYRQILRQDKIDLTSTLEQEQAELVEIGIVKEQKGKFRVANRIYEEIFSLSWVEQELLRLQSHRLQLELLPLKTKARYPYSLLEKILNWTGAQPYLTQKLCQLVIVSEGFIDAGKEEIQVELLVRRLLGNWENQAIGEHLKTIRHSLLDNRHCKPWQLLEVYRQILAQGEIIAERTPEQVELLEIGLIKQQQGVLSIANRIYEEVFNLSWVEQELLRLQSHRLQLDLLPLKEKASYPYRVLEEIFHWTGAQPYLTQKCQLIVESNSFIRAGKEAIQVEQLVRDRILYNWEHQSAGEHLRLIRQRLLNDKAGEPSRRLNLYRQILSKEEILSQRTPEQKELLEIGIVKEQQNKVSVANRIYEEIFNLFWVEQELFKALPLSAIAPTAKLEDERIVEIQSEPKSKETKGKKRKLPLILLLGAIAGAFGAGFYLFSQRQELEFFQEGNQLLEQGNYQQAIAKYDEILADDANYYQAWTNRGYALAGLRQYHQMLESCTTATIVEPQAIYAWNCQGEALHNLKQYDRAIASFDKAIALDENDPVFWINKSESLLSSKQPQEALITSEKAIEIFQAIEQTNGSESIKREFSIALTSKARALRENQQYAEALEAYDRALKYSPDYFVAQRGKGMTLQNLGRFQEAIAVFDRIIDNPNKSDGQKAEAFFYKGLTLCELQQPQAAFTVFEEALKLKPNYQEAKNAKITCGY
jgi:tetratricopeptide (TPR) repeat protein